MRYFLASPLTPAHAIVELDLIHTSASCKDPFVFIDTANSQTAEQ